MSKEFSIIIEATETLTAIDIDSFSTDFVSINLKAVSFVIKEIKKRNIGGIIIVDFFRMKKKEKYDRLKQEIFKYCQMDKNLQFLGFTPSYMAEFSRYDDRLRVSL